MKALGSWIFIKRLPVEKKHLGMEISEKALTKNYAGEITASGCYKNVTVGDRVLIPHYGVIDYEVDGEEFAVVRQGKLFAKITDDEYSPINGFVKVRKCVNDHIRDESGAIALHMTENHIENTTWVEVIDVAEDCKNMRKEYIGMFCVAPESSENLQRILYSKDYMLHEDEIQFLTTGE